MNNIQPIPIKISDDDPTDEELQLAFKRSCKEFGDCIADYESDEFLQEFGDQLNRILTESSIQGLVNKELIMPMVRDDGQIGYILTKSGQRLSEANHHLMI